MAGWGWVECPFLPHPRDGPLALGTLPAQEPGVSVSPVTPGATAPNLSLLCLRQKSGGVMFAKPDHFELLFFFNQLIKKKT